MLVSFSLHLCLSLTTAKLKSTGYTLPHHEMAIWPGQAVLQRYVLNGDLPQTWHVPLRACRSYATW